MYEPIEIKEEVKKNISIQEIEKHRVKHTDEIPKPDVVLSINGQIVSTRKNIFGITGKAKVGKSFLMSLINGSVIQKGDFHNVLSSYLPKGKDGVIYVDTEQSTYHVSLVLNRIKGMVDEYKMDNLKMYAFDAVRTNDRYLYTEYLIYNTENIGLVIIDGIADLVKSVNDEIIACDMADTLRRWATERDIAIGYVLHQNPSDNAKMRGHLGTVLMNKSETVIQISSSKEDESVKLVETTQTRNKKPDNFSFEIIEGVPVIMDEVYQEPKLGRKPAKVLADFEKYTLLSDIFAGVYKGNGIGYNVLLDKLKTSYAENHGQISDSKIKELIKYCAEMNWIVKDGGHKSNYFIYDYKK